MSARDLSNGASIDRHEAVYYGVFATDDDAPPLALFTSEADAWTWVKQQQAAEELCMDGDVLMVGARMEAWNCVETPGEDAPRRLLDLLRQDVPS